MSLRDCLTVVGPDHRGRTEGVAEKTYWWTGRPLRWPELEAFAPEVPIIQMKDDFSLACWDPQVSFCPS